MFLLALAMVWFFSWSTVRAAIVSKHDTSFTPDFSLRISLENITQGCSIRESVVVNGTSPGPTLRIKPNKVTWIRVYNEMTDQNLTMHWHGLSQRMAIFSDGTPISQWPIAPQHFFDYEILPGENDTGTSFYHSHVGVQAMTANGALIIEDIENPPYMYDDERLIHLTDYFNKSDHAIEMGLTSTPFVWSGETMAVLVNGVGVGIGKQNDTGCELPVIDVEPGKTYRLRFIGATALSHVSLAIEGHANLTIIAADARYTQPYQVSHIQLGTGQRFDVILKTKTIEELVKLRRTQFWLQFETRDLPTIYRGYGSFRYRLPKNEGSSMPKIDENFGPKIIEDYMPPAPASPPLSLPNITYNWLEYALRPLRPNNFPTGAEVTRHIYMTVQQFQSGSIYWAQNGNNWTDTPERTPMLIDLYKRGDAAMPNHTRALENNGWDPETRLWSAKTGEVLEIIIQNTGSLVKNAGALDIHPFHAHAGHFYDIGSGNGTYDPVANEIRLQDYRPVLRDTTMVYRYGTAGIAGQAMSWRGWRLRVSDPGAYIIHCHILQHMVMGMSTGWVFGDSAAEITSIPFDNVTGYLDFNGNAYGSASLYPEVLEYFASTAAES